MDSKATAIMKRWISVLMIKMGRIKSIPIEITEISQMIDGWLPEELPIAIPGGSGELTINTVILRIGKQNKEKLKADLMCNLKVRVERSVIFQTNLKLVLEADPDYSINSKTIGVKNTVLAKIHLIDDKDSFIKDVSNLANGVLPTPLKDMFNVALAASTTLLGEKMVSGLTRYLSIYNSGNQQKVIDYHQRDIERKLVELTSSENMRYQLDNSSFEEKLFADFGKKIVIENGQLLFLF